MDPSIDNRTATIGGASETLSMSATKEFVSEALSGVACINRTPRQVSWTRVDVSNPGNTGHAIRSKPAPSPILIGSPTISPDCGIGGILQVGKKRQSTSPDKVSNAQKLDTVVDGKLSNDRGSATIVIKVIGRKLSRSSRNDLYSRCRMKFSSNIVQTEAPQFVDLGLLAINTFNESDVLGTTDTSI